MTSPTRSPFSNPFKIRRRGSLFSPQAAYWTHAAARIPPQYMNSFHVYTALFCFLCISSQYSYFIYPLGVNHSPCCPPLSIYKTYTRLLVILDSPLPWPRTSTTPFYETPPRVCVKAINAELKLAAHFILETSAMTDCQLHLAYESDTIEMAIGQINADLFIPRVNLTLSESLVAVVSLAMCDKVKALGVVLVRDLTFSDDFSHVTQRALCRLNVLFYCLPFHGNRISREDVGRIQNLQNSAIRFIFNLIRVDHISPFRDALKLLPVEAVCRLLTCCMVYKVFKFRESQYLSKKLLYRGGGGVFKRSIRQDRSLPNLKVSEYIVEEPAEVPIQYNKAPASRLVPSAKYRRCNPCLAVEGLERSEGRTEPGSPGAASGHSDPDRYAEW
ncbi:hypothetical protein J6590_094107 [Homalodisca vitripennis]|nr:hypothetical protein J6590_094107 [Homalodisca vitripennis]